MSLQLPAGYALDHAIVVQPPTQLDRSPQRPLAVPAILLLPFPVAQANHPSEEVVVNRSINRTCYNPCDFVRTRKVEDKYG